MAVRILTTDGTPTTGTWYRSEAQDLDNTASMNAGQALSTSAYNLAFTPANAGNQVGLVVYVKKETSWAATDTITIKLQENVATVWTDRTTDTFTMDLATLPCKGGYHFFALTTYAITAAASTWRYAITANASTRFSLCASSNVQYAVILDANSDKPTTNDSVIVANGKTLTVSSAITWGGASLPWLVLCSSSTFQATSSAAYSITTIGQVHHSTNGNFLIGSSGSPISVANKITWDATTATLLFCGLGLDGTGYATNEFNVKIWGAENNNMFTRIASDANSGQAVITGRDDMSAIWSNSDTTYVVGSLATDANTYAISSMAGAAITMTGNFASKKLKGGAITNYDERTNLGVSIVANSTCLMFTYLCYQNIEIVGVQLNRVSCNNFGIASTSTSALWRSCFFENTNVPITTYSALGIDIPEIEMDNIVRWNPASASSFAGFNIFRARNVTMTDCIGGGATSAYFFYLSVCTTVRMTGCVASNNGYYAPYYASYWLAYTNDVIIDDCFGLGNGLGRAIEPASSALTVRNSWMQTATGGSYPVYLQSGTAIRFENTEIGTAATPATSQLECTNGAFVQAVFSECTFGSGTLVGTQSNLVDGSHLAIDEHNDVANTHYYYQKYGTITNVGDGLSDTTVRTSGTGKFALRFEPDSSANNLAWSFNVPTGDISTKTMTVSVWCKINNAAYYAGTHQLPRLTINYDDGTTAYAEATETTDWQRVSVSFTPTTAFGQITCTFSARTDATTTNRYVYFDDTSLQYPPEVSLDLGGMDLHVDAMPVTPPIALPVSAGSVAQAVWDASRSAHTTAGTMGEEKQDKIKYIVDGEIPIA